MDESKRKLIIEWLERIEYSDFTIAAFFKNHDVPFSKAQYFIYKKRFSIGGSEGLEDRRKQGGNRKLSWETEGFILGCAKSKPDISLGWLQEARVALSEVQRLRAGSLAGVTHLSAMPFTEYGLDHFGGQRKSLFFCGLPCRLSPRIQG